LGSFFSERALPELSIYHLTRAIELNPLYSVSYGFRHDEYEAIGDFEKSEADLQKCLELDPQNHNYLWIYASLLITLQRFDEAEKLIKNREQIYPDPKSNQILRTYLLVAKGEMEKIPEIDLSPFQKFVLHLFQKKKEEVIKYLNEDFERVKKSQNSWYHWFKNHPAYEYLHSDPRFQEILAKHKELYEENLRKYGDIDI
jgi:tetratricopeptide (TPR) repeat protein